MQQYGLIGKQLSHSFSKKYFENKFKEERITNVQYELFELDSIEQLKAVLSEHQFIFGLNVTIPYKEVIIPYLNELDLIAKTVGAVNTIKIERKEKQLYLKGYNTDVIGFEQSLIPLLKNNHQNALIFGTGGASKAIAYVLNKLGITYKWVSRNPKTDNSFSYHDIDKEIIKSHPLLINCTPLGMYPNTEECISIDFNGIGKNHIVYDLIYNPIETHLLKMAKNNGATILNGLAMLELQAEAAWDIWQEK